MNLFCALKMCFYCETFKNSLQEGKNEIKNTDKAEKKCKEKGYQAILFYNLFVFHL